MPKPSAQKRTSKEERAWLRQREKQQKLAKRREAREPKPEREGQGDRQTERQQ